MKSTNPVAIVSGSAKRIGAAICEYLHAYDFNVIVHYRNSHTEAQQLTQQLNQVRDDSAICIQSDINNQQACHTLATAALNKWQRIDVLINNASDYFSTPFANVSQHEWQQLINSNLTSAFFLSQTCTPALIKTNGTIINITDTNLKKPYRNFTPYFIGKAGINMLTTCLAKELAPDVRVNAIALGPTLWSDDEENWDKQEQQRIIDKSLLKHMTHVNDVCETIRYLIKNTSITGDIIDLGCGR